MTGRPRSEGLGYYDGPPIDREASDRRREQLDSLGSQMLAERTIMAIANYANDNRLGVDEAARRLLSGEMA
jgi:hypothetical protein